GRALDGWADFERNFPGRPAARPANGEGSIWLLAGTPATGAGHQRHSHPGYFRAGIARSRVAAPILPHPGTPGVDSAGHRPGASLSATAQQIVEPDRPARDGQGWGDPQTHG